MRTLRLEHCYLGEAGLGPLCDALPLNGHLRELDISHNHAPAGFTRARLLPAVRANTGLRTLLAYHFYAGWFMSADDTDAINEAVRIVAER